MPTISRSVPKVDFDEKVSGRAQFVADIQLEGMLHAKTFRSKEAHALIQSIKLPELPSGYFVIDHRDIPHVNYVKMIFKDWKIFADEQVNYVGEPILLVVGPNPSLVRDLIDQIEISYTPLEPNFEFSKSVIHKSFTKGSPKEAFKKAKQTIEHTYKTGYQEQAYIEPQGMIGYLESDDKMTFIGSIQCPYYVKNALVEMLQCPEDQVRVIQAAVGGAFGGKEEFPSMIACQLALAVKKTRKPVRLIYEREEDMVSTTKRHPSLITLKAFLDEKQHLIGIKAHVSLDSGAYIGLSGVVLSRAMLAVTAAYTIHHLDVSGDVYETNTVPNGAFRGFGAPQMIFAIEMFMSHIAKALHLNEFDFRMRYLAKQGDYTSTSGVFRDPIIMDKMIEKACEVSNYHEKRALYSAKNSFKGIGMSWFLHGCGFTGSGESTHINAKVKLKKTSSGEVFILVAAVDMGQGAKTSLKKIVEVALGLEPNRVIFEAPDTDFVPDSGPTVASRTTMIVGGLLKKAADQLKADWVDGQEQIVMKRYEQLAYITWDEDSLQGDAYPAYSWGVNICEVEVNPVTYQVDIKQVWSVYDVGRSIDDRMVFGQADGGILQGIAYGYMEVMQHQKGHLRQKNLTDYIIPTSVDAAPTETYLYENPFELGPYGAKGVGELTLVGGAPAVALAIEQAIGHSIYAIPATPETIMEVLSHDQD